MKSFKQFAIVLAALCLAACFSNNMTRGTKVDDSQLSQFQRGRTSYADVLTALGPPNSTTTMPDGSKIISYMYSASHTSVVPFSGSNVSTQSNMTTLRFGPDGLLKDYSTSQNSM